MRRHHARDARRGERPEGHQLDALEPLAVVLDARQLEVAVDAGVAVPREVLRAGGDAFALQAEREGDRVARDLVGIAREAAIADHRVRRVRVDIGDGGEVEIDAQVGELAAERAGQRPRVSAGEPRSPSRRIGGHSVQGARRRCTRPPS